MAGTQQALTCVIKGRKEKKRKKRRKKSEREERNEEGDIWACQRSGCRSFSERKSVGGAFWVEGITSATKCMDHSGMR